MKSMIHSYHGFLMSPRMVALAPSFAVAQRRAYDIARPASNMFANTILNGAVINNNNIAHGTTMTGGAIGNLLDGLKDSGYTIDLLICYAPDQVRVDSVEHRVNDQSDYHVTPEDVRSKGKLFPQRFETYFKKADDLTLFWREDPKGAAVKAAEFTKGKKTVLDDDAYKSFTEQFVFDRAKLVFNKNAGTDVVVPPSLDALEKLYKDRFSAPTTPVQSPGA